MVIEVVGNSSSNEEDRKRALNAALDQIDKAMGKGLVMRLGEKPKISTDIIPSGSLGLDIAMGIGGYPKGRVVEIYGPESSGKSTLALHAVAQAQKLNGYAAYIDAEHAMDMDYAANLGVDIDQLIISQPDTGEQALEICETLVRSGGVDIIVIDSVAALTPRSEIEGEMGDTHMGLQARLMSQALRKLTAAVGRTNTLLIFINQIRMKIGVLYGNPETTTGGIALKFYSSMRLDIRQISAKVMSDNKDEAPIGRRTRVKVVKNKMAPPFRQVEFDILFGQGISRIGELIDLGVHAEIIDKSGSWFSYKDQRLGQGREKVRLFLKANPEIANEIESILREKSGFIDKSKSKGDASSTSKRATTKQDNATKSKNTDKATHDTKENIVQ